MKLSTISCLFVLFTLLSLLAFSTETSAQQLPINADVRSASLSGPKSSGGGIKEEIPDKYKERYQSWKSEFLASETGLAQWQKYEQNAEFTLTITVTKDDHNGAGSGKYKWDDSGRLIAATITLGNRIDEGYPNPIYYPVMNSLAQCTLSYAVSGNILAAAKIAHEFGHVNRMVETSGATYKLQAQLMPTYNKILLSNGRNTNDPRLIELAQQMGGTPVEIWEDREYWGEVNAMLYLRDRITKESEQRALFTKIIRTVELYAKSYVDRFDQVGQ
jgi:YD repeat-containing protein